MPFQIRVQRPNAAGVAIPTVVRGAIDLVFLEQDGWVIVDYKTDQLQGRTLAAMAAHYAPQVRLYAEAWRACTGQTVKELGLLFAQRSVYVTVAAHGPGAGGAA